MDSFFSTKFVEIYMFLIFNLLIFFWWIYVFLKIRNIEFIFVSRVFYVSMLPTNFLSHLHTGKRKFVFLAFSSKSLLFFSPHKSRFMSQNPKLRKPIRNEIRGIIKN